MISSAYMHQSKSVEGYLCGRNRKDLVYYNRLHKTIVYSSADMQHSKVPKGICAVEAKEC